MVDKYVYVIEKTLEKVKEGLSPVEAFAWACDDENYYGMRPDIVQERLEMAGILRERYGYRTITDAVARMDPVQVLELAGKEVPPWYKGLTGSGFGSEIDQDVYQKRIN